MNRFEVRIQETSVAGSELAAETGAISITSSGSIVAAVAGLIAVVSYFVGEHTCIISIPHIVRAQIHRHSHLGVYQHRYRCACCQLGQIAWLSQPADVGRDIE